MIQNVLLFLLSSPPNSVRILRSRWFRIHQDYLQKFDTAKGRDVGFRKLLSDSENKYSITSSYIVSRLRRFTPAPYSKTSVSVPKYDADNVFKLLNYIYQDFTLDHIVEIGKQSA